MLEKLPISSDVKLNEHRKAEKKVDFGSRQVINSLKTDHKSDFDNVKILV